MGWNTSAFFFENSSTEELLGVLPDIMFYNPLNEDVDFETASSAGLGDKLAIGNCKGWSIIWDPQMRVPPSMGKFLSDNINGIKLEGRRGFAIVFSSVGSTYAYWLYDGAQCIRKIVFTNGDPAEQEGSPHPDEANAPIPSWGPDENFLFFMTEKITGITFEELSKTTWHKYSAEF